MNKAFVSVLYVILFVFILAIGSVVISDGAEIVANLGKFIMGLFQKADLNPKSKGFGAFIQLISIAFFVGWTINRFKRKKINYPVASERGMTKENTNFSPTPPGRGDLRKPHRKRMGY